jgi:dihydrodipicolinate reductase
VVGLVDLDTAPLKDLLKQDVDAVVDFTNAGCAIENAYLCLENNINYLSGTTGISESVIRKIGRIAKRKKLSLLFVLTFL